VKPERLSVSQRAMAAATLAARLTADRPDLPRRPAIQIAYGVRGALAAFFLREGLRSVAPPARKSPARRRARVRS
jgi:hypothetical protein